MQKLIKYIPIFVLFYIILISSSSFTNNYSLGEVLYPKDPIPAYAVNIIEQSEVDIKSIYKDLKKLAKKSKLRNLVVIKDDYGVKVGWERLYNKFDFYVYIDYSDKDPNKLHIKIKHKVMIGRRPILKSITKNNILNERYYLSQPGDLLVDEKNGSMLSLSFDYLNLYALRGESYKDKFLSKVKYYDPNYGKDLTKEPAVIKQVERMETKYYGFTNLFYYTGKTKDGKFHDDNATIEYILRTNGAGPRRFTVENVQFINGDINTSKRYTVRSENTTYVGKLSPALRYDGKAQISYFAYGHSYILTGDFKKASYSSLSYDVKNAILKDKSAGITVKGDFKYNLYKDEVSFSSWSFNDFVFTDEPNTTYNASLKMYDTKEIKKVKGEACKPHIKKLLQYYRVAQLKSDNSSWLKAGKEIPILRRETYCLGEEEKEKYDSVLNNTKKENLGETKSLNDRIKNASKTELISALNKEYPYSQYKGYAKKEINFKPNPWGKVSIIVANTTSKNDKKIFFEIRDGLLNTWNASVTLESKNNGIGSMTNQMFKDFTKDSYTLEISGDTEGVYIIIESQY